MRREYCEPMYVATDQELKADMLSAITDALWFSDVWTRLVKFDAAPYGTRKELSRWGAVPRRTTSSASGSGAYEDVGNRCYRNILWLMEFVATKLGLPALSRPQFRQWLGG